MENALGSQGSRGLVQGEVEYRYKGRGQEAGAGEGV